MIKLNESEARNNDIFKPIHYDISNKENIRSQNIRKQGTQGECLNEEGKIFEISPERNSLNLHL